MKNIKLIACDIDGVLLEDTFSVVLNNMSKKLNFEYTSELERNTFSQSREQALKYMSNILNIQNEDDAQHLLQTYFLERDKFIARNGNPILEATLPFLERLKSLKVKLICYGGLDIDMIDTRFLPYLKVFDQYICTDTFRPGLKEITKQFYNLEYSEVLFIDDVNKVAEEAKKYDIPFIGVPTKHTWGFQEQQMIETGVKYRVNGIQDITLDYLNTVAGDPEIWGRNR